MLFQHWSIPPLYYTAPVLTTGYYYGAQLFGAIRLEKACKKRNSKSRRSAYLSSLLAIETTLLLEAGLYLRQALTESSSSSSSSSPPPRHEVISCISYILAYGSIISSVLSSDAIIWKQHLGPHAITLALQASMLWTQSGAIVSWTRLVCLALMCAQTAYYDTYDASPDDKSIAVQSTTTSPEKSSKGSSSLEDDEIYDDSDDEDYKALKQQQKERLDRSGDWLTYLKSYKICIPLLWPFHNFKLQCCIAFLVAHLMVSRIFGILVPRQMGIIADKLALNRGEFPVFDILIWAALTICESDLFVTLRDMAFTPIQQYAWRTISATAFRHVMTLSMDFHNDKSSSDTVRIVEQGQALSDVLYFICFEAAPLIADVTIAIIYVTSSFDPYMALIMLAGGVAYAWLGMISSQMSTKRRRKFNQAMTELDKFKYEGLSNWQTVTQFNRNKWESDRYDENLAKYCEAENNMSVIWNGIRTLQSSVLTLARVGATALAMYRVSQGEIPLGQLVTFTAVWSTIMNPITSLTWIMRRMQQMLTDSERLLQLLQTKPSIVDKSDARPFEHKAGMVEFQNVDFAYDARKATLESISFVAKPGMTIALVGETGGGKSTLVKLLYRYYDVTGGSIRIDGQDIRDVTLDSLREIFGLVPQDPALFNTTLIENLRYARLDATDEEIHDACKAACIHDKIMQFPDKYNSKVGERGVKLSGGEMQRVAIARAILRDPKIVLLDEATSMIDAETESEIQKALRRLTAGRTTFVVAHRLSTIQHADLILVIENGRIIERGNHEDLFRKPGKYVALWSKQMSKTIVDLVPSGTTTPPTSVDGDSASENEQQRIAIARRRVRTAAAAAAAAAATLNTAKQQIESVDDQQQQQQQ